MHCPDCGYSMTAFDRECPRCERLRARRKGCPHCGTAAPLEAAQCLKCGHTYRTSYAHEAAARRDEIIQGDEFAQGDDKVRVGIAEDLSNAPTSVSFLSAHSSSPKPASSQPSSPKPSSPKPAIPLATPLTAEMLACRMCGSTAAQKVSAVCQSGTWSSASRGSSVGAIYTADGMIPVTSVSTTSSAGGTLIAQRLMPPPRPFFRHSWAASIIVPITGYLIALCLCGQGLLAVSVTIAITSFLWFFALLSESRAEAAGQARLQTDHARWQEGMKVWDRLFYCSRCDHVYDPQGGAAAPPAGMQPLLFSHLPTIAALPLRELPLRLPPQKAAAIVGGCALVGLGLLWGVSNSIMQSAQENAAQENAAQMNAAQMNAAQTETAPPETYTPTAPDPSSAASYPSASYPSASYPAPEPPPVPAYGSSDGSGSTVGSSTDGNSAAPAFKMTTQAGGGPPPDVSQFNHK